MHLSATPISVRRLGSFRKTAARMLIVSVLAAFEGAYLVRHRSRMNSLPRIVNLISARSDCVAPIYSVYTVSLLKEITYAR
jgi:hypothetical protein